MMLDFVLYFIVNEVEMSTSLIAASPLGATRSLWLESGLMGDASEEAAECQAHDFTIHVENRDVVAVFRSVLTPVFNCFWTWRPKWKTSKADSLSFLKHREPWPLERTLSWRGRRLGDPWRARAQGSIQPLELGVVDFWP